MFFVFFSSRPTLFSFIIIVKQNKYTFGDDVSGCWWVVLVFGLFGCDRACDHSNRIYSSAISNKTKKKKQQRTLQKKKQQKFEFSLFFFSYGAAAATPAPALGPFRRPPGPRTTLTNRRLYWSRRLARPVFGFFLSSFLATYLQSHEFSNRY